MMTGLGICCARCCCLSQSHSVILTSQLSLREGICASISASPPLARTLLASILYCYLHVYLLITTDSCAKRVLCSTYLSRPGASIANGSPDYRSIVPTRSVAPVHYGKKKEVFPHFLIFNATQRPMAKVRQETWLNARHHRPTSSAKLFLFCSLYLTMDGPLIPPSFACHSLTESNARRIRLSGNLPPVTTSDKIGS
jgi:hypothetical protein